MMIQFLLLHASLYALVRAPTSKQNNITSICSGQLFITLPLSFNITYTQSKSLSLILPLPTPIPPLIPTTVTAPAKTAGSVASATSIASVSASSVPQASRINTISNLLTCNADNTFDAQPLDWNASPTQLYLGSGMFRYVDGAVLGNWLLFGVTTATYTIATLKFGAVPLRYPGPLMLVNLFLSAPTAQAAVTLLRFGNVFERILGSLSLLAQLGSIVGISRFLWKDFPATTEKEPTRSFFSEVIRKPIYSALNLPVPRITRQKWLSLEANNDYVYQYRPLFKDYRKPWYGFIAAELTMTISSGVLDAFQVDPASSCNPLLYVSTAVYGVYAVSIVFIHPHRQQFDRYYFGVVATAQFAALLIGSLRIAIPSLQNNTELQTVAEGIPVALQYVILVRSAYDLTVQSYALYKYSKGQLWVDKKLALDLDSGDQAMTLQVPLTNAGHDGPDQEAPKGAMNAGYAIRQLVHRTVTPDLLSQREVDTSGSSSDEGEINPHRRTLEAALKGAMADSLLDHQDGIGISLTPDHEAHNPENHDSQPILTDLQKAILDLNLKDSQTVVPGTLSSDIEDML